MSIFAVIDTNVVVSALLSKNEDAATVRVITSIFEGRITPLYNPSILAEYGEVLRRERFHLNGDDVEAVITEIRQLGISLSGKAAEEVFSDNDDRIFYEVVMEKRETDEASYLVTGNIKHYPAKPFVVTPAEMMKILDSADDS
jgi:putative PIN family toxin of toxin-antitoxin system